ncbi:cupin domain-containing protein [Chloroflexota bacterium]
MEEKKESGWGGVNIYKPTVDQFRFASKEMESRWGDLLSRPRVIKKSDIPPVQEGVLARGVDLDKFGMTTLISFFEDFSPGSAGLNHGHMNEAVLYILKGKGYEIHDGEKFEWEAGDLVIVPNSSVHCHLNSDPKESAQVVVINPKPLFMFMNLLAQRLVHRPDEVKRQD